MNPFDEARSRATPEARASLDLALWRFSRHALQVYTSTGTHFARAIGGRNDKREYPYPAA